MSVIVTSGTEKWAADYARRSGGIRGVKLGYEPFAKQNQFHASRAKYRLFGGAAGPGKSKALLFEAILQAIEHPGSNVLVLRRTFPELEQSLLTYFRKDVPRELYSSFNESKHVVTMNSGSTLRFGYCQRESDVYQYQGAEFLFIGIDELTLFTLRQWQFLTSRNRCPLPGAFPCMAAATNPGNIGHAWVKSLWIDKKPASGMDHPDQYDPADYEFIAARVTDNPIYASDKSYLKTLRALPSHLRRAFLDGDWDVFAGQYFDRFDPAQSVFRAEEIEWKPWWPRWISIDWGFEHPAAVYWHASAPAASEPARLRDEAGGMGARGLDASAPDSAERGKGTHCTFTYREFVTRRTAPRDLAREIIARSLASGVEGAGREKIDAIYLSPDAFARRTDEASIAEQMGDIFVDAGFPRPVPADDDRVSGWMLMYQMLDAREWFVTDNCIELIRTLPTLVRDTAKIEDIEKMDGDDAADAARYGLKSRYAVRGSHAQPPIEQRLAERVTSIDPTIRAIQARKAQIDESRRVQPVFVRRKTRR
ncbi:MAG TPA: phage terminase large subunit [Candidatus Acidoferrales bacterium]|nr:phage terminase large subunit [Candidatus Acidoferrales bacterium]